MMSGKNRCQNLEGNVKAVKIASIIGQGDGTLDVDGIAWKDLRGNVILLCTTLPELYYGGYLLLFLTGAI